MKKFKVWFIVIAISFIIQPVNADIHVPNSPKKAHIYIDKKGNQVKDDFAQAKMDKYINKNYKIDLVSGQGKDYKIGYKKSSYDKEWVIKPKFEEGDHLFVNGSAAVRINKKWGIINTKGKWIIEPKYDSIVNFSEGLAAARLNDKVGFLNKKGQWVINPKFIDLFCFYKTKDYYSKVPFFCQDAEFHDGLAPVIYDKDFIVHDKNLKIYIPVIPEKFNIQDETEVWGKVKKDKYYIKAKVNKFDKLFLTHGLYEKRYKLGYINKQGDLVIKDDFREIENFSDGLAAVRKDKLFGYIDKNGEFILPPKYVEAYNFYNGYAPVAVFCKSKRQVKSYYKKFK